MQGARQAKRGGHRATVGAVALGAALLILSTGAAAATPLQRSAPRAQRTLKQAVTAVQSPAQASTGGDATLALRDLALALPKLRGADRRQAKALLQRPPVGQQGPAENSLSSGWNAPESPNSPVCSAHFCVHFVDIGEDAPPRADNDGRRDGDGVPDYVEKVRKTVERAYAKENTKLGWRKPKPDGNRGGNSKVDVYLSQIGNVGLFGYANTDPKQPAGQRRFSYLVLDNDYREFAPLTPLKALQVTVAHEYNHILQFGIDFNQQVWMFEASATWMEEQVFPAVSDWLRYVPAFAGSVDKPLTRPSAGGGLKIYGDATFLHYLSRGLGLGHDVVRDAWVKSPKTRPRHFASAAFGASLRKNGGPGFGKAFSKFAAASAEWNAGHKFADAKRLHQVERQGKLKVGHSKRARLDHLAFELYNVKAGNSGKIKLRVKAKKGTRSAVALVGRKGSRKKAKVRTKLSYLRHGGKGVVRLRHPQRFDRITAVVVNSEARAGGKNRAGNRAFRGENNAYRLHLSRVNRHRHSAACRCRG